MSPSAARPERAPLDAAACAALLGVSRETRDRLERLVALLERWQARFNLVGARTLGDVWRRHVLDSGQLAAHLPAAARRITDLGSGAGFPGLVLALLTGCETDLIEAEAAKAAFLREAVRETAAPCRVHHGRIEALAPWPTDAVTARGLAPLPRLLAYAEPFLRASAGRDPVCIFPKGARWRSELTDSARMWHMSLADAPSLTDPAARVLVLSGVERAQRPEANQR